MSEPIVKAEKCIKTFKLAAEEIAAVNGVDLEINKGEFVALMGPSGSGKTTLLNVIGCLDAITSGTLTVLGNDISCVRENELVRIRRGNIGYIFQEFLLISSLTALENVELSLYFARISHGKEKSIQLLEKVGLGHRINHLPKELSGGEKQRVAIARALVTSPQLLLADEPTGNLDSGTAHEIFDVFKQLNTENGLSIIIATHNQELGSRANRIIYLRDGKSVSA